MKFKRLLEEKSRLEMLKNLDELTETGLETLTELDQALQLLQAGVSGSYSKKIAFENIEQMLIEKLADFLDSEDILIIEKDANLKYTVKREESFLHIRMAQSAMREYKLTMFGL